MGLCDDKHDEQMEAADNPGESQTAVATKPRRAHRGTLDHNRIPRRL